MIKLRGRLAALVLSSVLLSACDSAGTAQSWSSYSTLGLYSAALSSDSQLALIGAQQEGGSLWNVSQKARLFDWNHEKGQRSLIAATAISPDGAFAATADQQNLVLWHTDTGQPEWFWQAPAEILAIALAPSADFALLGLANQQAIIFDIKNGGIKHSLNHKARVRAVALSKDGKTAITGSDDYSARTWDTATGKRLALQTHNNQIDTVALSPDGKIAFSASSLDAAIVWDALSGKLTGTLATQDGFFPKRISYSTGRFSGDGSQLLTGTASGLVQLWSPATSQEIKRWRAHKKAAYGPTSTSILAVSFGPSGYYAIGSNGILNQFK